MPRHSLPSPIKYCLYCNKLLTRKRFPSSIEDMGCFKRRKFCDLMCMAKGRIRQKVTLAGLRKRAEKLRGNRCEQCGAIIRLGIHHMDSNPANNSPENLKTLCASCHTTWHWKNGKKPWKRQSVCKVCAMPARKLDMCQKHYQRFKKYGDPCLTKKQLGSQFVLLREILFMVNGRTSPVLLMELKTESTVLKHSAT